MVIAVTQRVDTYGTYQETRSALDVRWPQFFNMHNLTSVVLSNNLTEVKRVLMSIKISALILTGGNDIIDKSEKNSYSKERSEVEEFLLNYSRLNGLPVLGVCRGFQMINSFLGGAVHKLDGHVNTFHNLHIVDNKFCRPKILRVNSYHNYGISVEELSEIMCPFAFDSDGNVEAAIHKSLKWIGLMWHPERDTIEIDKKIIDFLFKEI